MPIEVTARHMDGAGAAKAYAQDHSEKLMEMFPRVESVHVIWDVIKYRHEAAVVVQGKDHIHVEATESSEDMVKSIDVAFDRAATQLRKLRQKIQDHRIKPGEKEEIKVD